MSAAIESVPEAHLCQSEAAGVLAEICREPVNLAIWQRPVETTVAGYVAGISTSVNLRTLFEVAPNWQDALLEELCKVLPEGRGREALNADILELAEMMACLFDVQQLGVRLILQKRAMCPAFHVDHLPVRLVTCYSGPGTEWLASNIGRADWNTARPNRVNTGDVALLKGEAWHQNAGFGVVHRSPALEPGQTRLFLSMDPVF